MEKNIGIHRKKTEKKFKCKPSLDYRIWNLLYSLYLLHISQIFFSDCEFILYFKDHIFTLRKKSLIPTSAWKVSVAFVWADLDQSWILSNSSMWSTAVLGNKRLSKYLSEILQSESWLLRGSSFVCERRSSDSLL